MKDWLSRQQLGWRAFWTARTPRERFALMAMAGILALGLISEGGGGLIARRDALRQQVAAMSHQALTLQAWQREWQALSSSALPTTEAGMEQAAILGSAQALDAGLQARWSDAQTLSVQGEVDFNRWIDWLARMHREQGLTVRRAKFVAAQPTRQVPSIPGRVRVELELGWSRAPS